MSDKKTNNLNKCAEEIWLPVVGYEGLYEISNLGNVRTMGRVIVDSIGRVRTFGSRLMKQTEIKTRKKEEVGYKQVRLTDAEGNSAACLIHRLVGKAFIENLDNKETINHIDGIKNNNNVDNLEWATYSENNKHARDIGLNNCKIPVFMKDGFGKIIEIFPSIHEAGRQTKTNYRNIHSVCVGKRKVAGGYIWSYATQEEMGKHNLFFAKVRANASIPNKKISDSGYDLYACFDEDYIRIKPGEIKMIPTGIACAFSSNYAMLLRERGSTGTRGLSLRAGVIDSGYRGEIFVPINNTTDKIIYIAKDTENFLGAEKKYIIYPYEKAICQAIMIIVPKLETKEVSWEELQKIKSERGMGNLGSTGK